MTKSCKASKRKSSPYLKPHWPYKDEVVANEIGFRVHALGKDDLGKGV